MLEKLFKLNPTDYEKLYKGELVTIGTKTLQLNLSDYSLTVDGSIPAIPSADYTIEVSDSYAEEDEIENMFSDQESVASPQDVASLFGSFDPGTRQLLLDLIYPVGSVYQSTTRNESTASTAGKYGCPIAELGGTWEKIEGKMLLASDSTHTIGSTGGAYKHTPAGTVQGHALTVNEMPSHGGHVYSEWAGQWLGHGNAGGKYIADLSTYGTDPRGWDIGAGEYYPASRSLGGDQAHSHGFTGTEADYMPPYQVVYMWKRTA